MNRIILSRTMQSWVGRYTGPHSEEVLRLFGSDLLPTAFTSAAPASVVLAEIRNLNPGVQVDLAPREG